MIPSIDHQDLSGPLRRLSGSATAEPTDWQVAQLGGGFGNPVSLGLYRVSGHARDEAGDFPWSLVLKAAQSPANVGMADLGGGDEPAHWNYWRREFHLYASGLLDHLPAGLAAPCFFGAADRPDQVYWLWLEEVHDRYHSHWPVERFGLAARHLGRLGASFLTDWQPAAYPWLARSTLRQWLGGDASIVVDLDDAGRMAAFMDQPLIARAFAGDSRELLRRCIDERHWLLDALNRLPHTFAHQDAYPTNLMARLDADGREETVLLDWGMAGLAPLGSDLGQLVIGLCQNHMTLPEDEAQQLLIDSYLAGLREMGWTGDEREVRLGFTATTVLRLTFLVIFFLQSNSEPPTGAAQDELVITLTKMARLLGYLTPQVFGRLDGMA